MAAGGIQPWAALAANHCSTDYKPGLEHASTDALNWLSLPVSPSTTQLPVFAMELLNSTPVSVKDIRTGTRRVSSNQNSDEVFKSYFTRKDELSVRDRCLLWPGQSSGGTPKERERVVEELHGRHPGIYMKALERSYVWWP